MNKLSLERWSNPDAFSTKWCDRNQAMFDFFKTSIGLDATMVFTEYGCGPYAPFKGAVSKQAEARVITYDASPWPHQNRIVNLNAPEFQVESSDVGVLSGVIEYLNDIERVLKNLKLQHQYLLLSYAYLPVADMKSEGSLISRLNRRAAENGWRNHVDLNGLIQLLGRVGYIEASSLWKSQVIVILNCSEEVQ